MVANIHLIAPLTRHQETQFATIKSTIDAVKFSNTIQLSPKWLKGEPNYNVVLLKPSYLFKK